MLHIYKQHDLYESPNVASGWQTNWFLLPHSQSSLTTVTSDNKMQNSKWHRVWRLERWCHAFLEQKRAKKAQHETNMHTVVDSSLFLVLRDVCWNFSTSQTQHATQLPRAATAVWEHRIFSQKLGWEVTQKTTTALNVGRVCLGGGIDQIKAEPWSWFSRQIKRQKEAKHWDMRGVSDFHLFSKDFQSRDKFILGLWLMLWLWRHWWVWL